MYDEFVNPTPISVFRLQSSWFQKYPATFLLRLCNSYPHPEPQNTAHK